MTVFLSHSSTDRAVTEHLASYLQRRGLTVWFASRDVPPGASWPDSITDAIASATAVVLLFSSAADQSEHVRREISLADRHRIPVFWVRLEGVEPARLGYFLQTTQWIDWMDRRDTSLEELVASLRRVEGAGQVIGSGPDESSGGRSPQALPGDVPATPEPIMVDARTLVWPAVLAVLPSDAAAYETAARVLFATALDQVDGTVLLPTGRTATPLFRAITRLAPEMGDHPLGDLVLMNDTETFGVHTRHASSRARHVQEHLLDRLPPGAFSPSQVHLLGGLITEDDPIVAARSVLRDHPPALHIVSISPTGEVIGYEVGTYTDMDDLQDDRPRVIELAETGRKYIDPDQPSRSVVTVGMGTALQARRSVVLVVDRSKARVLRQVMTQPPTSAIPASLLRLHTSAIVITTTGVAAAAGLVGSSFDDPLVAAREVFACS